MHFTKAVLSLFALASFTAGDHGANDDRAGLARRELTTAYAKMMRARDEYIEKRRLYLRETHKGPKPPKPKGGKGGAPKREGEGTSLPPTGSCNDGKQCQSNSDDVSGPRSDAKREPHLQAPGDDARASKKVVGKRAPAPVKKEAPQGTCKMTNNRPKCTFQNTYCGECPNKPVTGISKFFKKKGATKAAKDNDPCRCSFYYDKEGRKQVYR